MDKLKVNGLSPQTKDIIPSKEQGAYLHIHLGEKKQKL